jgi:hypothetical protein
MKRNRFIAGKRPRKYALLILLIVLCASALVAFAVRHSSSDNYIMLRDVLDTGGGYSESTNYVLENSIGQSTPIGESGSTNYHLYAGFQIPQIILDPVNELVIGDTIISGDTLWVLYWPPVEWATGYKVYQNLNDPFTTSYAWIGSTTGTSYTIFNKDTLSIDKGFYRVSAIRTR